MDSGELIRALIKERQKLQSFEEKWGLTKAIIEIDKQVALAKSTKDKPYHNSKLARYFELLKETGRLPKPMEDDVVTEDNNKDETTLVK